VPFGNALRFHELIQRSQLHVYGCCGHWTQIEQAASFSRLVIDFLREPDS
jgi:2-hydroxymuconate-semialdehyde hydrolase